MNRDERLVRFRSFIEPPARTQQHFRRERLFLRGGRVLSCRARVGLAWLGRRVSGSYHRMAVLTVAMVLGALEQWGTGSHWALKAACWTIAVGSVVTCGTRTAAIARRLGMD